MKGSTGLNDAPLPLSGIRVVDLTRNLSGPYCTMMLGDMGAEVLKVEHPNGGDELRNLYQFPGKSADSQDYFGMFNRNKRSITLDLKSDEDREVLDDLLAVSDVFVQNLAPGATDRLGFGWPRVHSLNRRLVYASISGFGPEDTRRAYDGVVQAASGVLDLTGYPEDPPALCGISIGDLSAAMFAAFAIVNALLRTSQTGLGTKIDVAMLDCLLALHGGGAALYMATGEESTRRGCEAPHRAPGNIYRTAEGRYIFLVTNNETWVQLCKALDLEDLQRDPRFVTNQDRVKNRSELNHLLGERIGILSLDTVTDLLMTYRVPHSPVATVSEVFESEHVQRHEMLVEVGGELRGDREPIRVMGIPYKSDSTLSSIRLGPPRLGEANDYVLQKILGRRTKRRKRSGTR